MTENKVIDNYRGIVGLRGKIEGAEFSAPFYFQQNWVGSEYQIPAKLIGTCLDLGLCDIVSDVEKKVKFNYSNKMPLITLEHLLELSANKGWKTFDSMHDYFLEYGVVVKKELRFNIVSRKPEPALQFNWEDDFIHDFYFGKLRENVLLKNRLFQTLVIHYLHLMGIKTLEDCEPEVKKACYRRELPSLVKSIGCADVTFAMIIEKYRNGLMD